MVEVQFDPTRFEELVLYIATRTADDASFGRTKMAKVLFYADFEAFRLFGAPLTGATYEKWAKGPFPPRLKSAERMLKHSGRADIDEQVEPYEEIRLIPLPGVPVLAHQLYTTEQLGLVDEWIEKVRRDSARNVSRLSHDFPGFELATPNARIPYETVFLAHEPPSDRDMEYAAQVAREHGEWP